MTNVSKSSSDDAVFTHGNLMRHVAVTSLSSSIGLMAIYAVDLIDLIFISMLGANELAAAAGYAGTLMFFASAVNIGLSIASGVLISTSRGRGDAQGARRKATSVAAFTVVIGVLIPVVILLNVDVLLATLGARPEVAQMAKSYLWITIPFSVLSGLAMVAVSALRAVGDSKRAMYPALAGAATNLVLDPIFIFGLGLGLEGAAVATVFARLVTMGLAIWLAVRLHDAFAAPELNAVLGDAREVMGFAVPSMLSNLAAPMGTAIVTNRMAAFGPEAVAGMAIVIRLAPVAFSVVLATSGAVGPIIGQNLGGGYLKRVLSAFVAGLQFIAIYVITISLLLLLLRNPIADVFDATGETRALVLLYCWPIALTAFFNGAVSLSGASFESLGHPVYATWINWGHQTLGTLPFVLVGGAWFEAPGVLMGQAAGAIVFALIAGLLALRLIKKPAERLRNRAFHRTCVPFISACYYGRG